LTIQALCTVTLHACSNLEIFQYLLFFGVEVSLSDDSILLIAYLVFAVAVWRRQTLSTAGAAAGSVMEGTEGIGAVCGDSAWTCAVGVAISGVA